MPDHEGYNEQELLRQIAEGNERAFVLLASRYTNNIYTTALNILKSAPIAEEVVQDVLLVVWKKRASLREVDNFPAWLYGISRNTIYYALRNLIKRREQEAKGQRPDHLFFHQDVEGSLLQKEYDQILTKAVQSLPARQRQVYILIKQRELKREEVARQLAISPETVKSNLEEAVRKIRAFCMQYLHQLLVLLVTFSR